MSKETFLRLTDPLDVQGFPRILRVVIDSSAEWDSALDGAVRCAGVEQVFQGNFKSSSANGGTVGFGQIEAKSGDAWLIGTGEGTTDLRIRVEKARGWAFDSRCPYKSDWIDTDLLRYLYAQIIAFSASEETRYWALRLLLRSFNGVEQELIKTLTALAVANSSGSRRHHMVAGKCDCCGAVYGEGYTVQCSGVGYCAP